MRDAPGTRLRIVRARISWKVMPRKPGVSKVRLVTASVPKSAPAASSRLTSGELEYVLEHGAKEVHACVTHAVLSGPAVERISGSELTSLVVTDTLPLRPEAERCPKIRTIMTSSLFCQAIRSIHNEDSVSNLFEVLF